jgi:hypothetical protein
VTWPAVAVVIAAVAGQAFWIGRALDALGKRLDDFKVDMGAGLDRIDARLAGIEAALVDHGERLVRIEAHRERS